MTKLLFQGRGSYRFITNDKRVIYLDPYAGEGYDLPADLILVTHQHGDHNRSDLCAKKPSCQIISNKEALIDGEHKNFAINGIEVQAVEASNAKHDPKLCVGYLITLDALQIYASGDTSKTKQMESFAALKLDYALFPGDGLYNMDLGEAAECAELVEAKHNILVHMDPHGLFNSQRAKNWNAPNKLYIEPGQEIEL